MFDSAHGLKQTLAFNSLPNQNVTVNLDISKPANNGPLGVGLNGSASITIRDGIALNVHQRLPRLQLGLVRHSNR